MLIDGSTRIKAAFLVIFIGLLLILQTAPLTTDDQTVKPGQTQILQESDHIRNPHGESDDIADRSHRASSDTLKIPTLVNGDTWTYHSDFVISGKFGDFDFDGTVTGDTTYVVDTMEDMVYNGTTYNCYKIDFTGTFQLAATAAGGIVSLDIDTVVEGSDSVQIADLSLVNKHTIHNGTITITYLFNEQTFGYNLSMNETYLKPMEEYDFPVYVDPEEEWSQDLNKFTSYEGDVAGDPFDNTSQERLLRSYSCTEIRKQMDLAGKKFDSHEIEVKESGETVETRYFAGDARNLVRTDIDSGTFLNTSEFSVTITSGRIDLTSIDLGTYGIELMVNAPEFICPNSTISISGTIPGVQTGDIQIEVPGEGISTTTTISNGNFQKQMYMEERADDTPSTSDIGSHGMILSYSGTPPVHRVVTVTLANPEVRVFSSNISYSLERFNETVPIVGEPVSINITVDNPSIVDLRDVVVRLLDDDIPVDGDKTMDIAQREKNSSLWTWIPGVPGTHQIKVHLDPTGLLNETYENNNIATLDVDVLDRPIPEITPITPGVGNISIYENERLNISAPLVELPGGIYERSWYFKMGNEQNLSLVKSNSDNFSFTTHYLGNLSSINSPFTIRFSVMDGAAYQNRSTNLTWIVNVLNVNRAPYFINVTPVNNTIQLKENGKLNFTIEGDDPDGTEPVTEWWFDGIIQNVSGNVYEYAADYNSSGTHTLEAVLRDIENSSEYVDFKWSIEVENVNRKCSAYIEYPDDLSEYYVGDEINFSANGTCDPDVDEDNYTKLLIIKWIFGDNSEPRYGMHVNHTYYHPGTYTVQLNVTDEDDASDIAIIKIKILKKEFEPEDTDDDDSEVDGDDSDRKGTSEMALFLWALLGIGLVLLIGAWSLLRLERKKKKKERDDMAKMSREEKGGLIGELVALEEEREDIRESIDRALGKLEQLDWDLEDGYISKERHNNLVTRYKYSYDHLKDELAEIDSQIEYLEIKVQRQEKRKDSKMRMYGGGGADDFYRPTYGELGRELAEEPEGYGYRYMEEDEEEYDDEDLPGWQRERRYHEEYDDDDYKYEKYDEDEDEEEPSDEDYYDEDDDGPYDEEYEDEYE